MLIFLFSKVNVLTSSFDGGVNVIILQKVHVTEVWFPLLLTS